MYVLLQLLCCLKCSFDLRFVLYIYTTSNVASVGVAFVFLSRDSWLCFDCFCVSLTGETDEQINIEKMTKEGVLPKQHKK